MGAGESVLAAQHGEEDQSVLDEVKKKRREEGKRGEKRRGVNG